jgi:hypothetical protein
MITTDIQTGEHRQDDAPEPTVPSERGDNTEPAISA